MSFSVQDEKVDVAIVAGPGLQLWPSVGVRTLSALCSDMGLTVKLLGPGGGNRGESGTVARGVIPSPRTGGLIIGEDASYRIHRIQARAIVRMVSTQWIPPVFDGWRSQGGLPLPTAQKLFHEAKLSWRPLTAILGTGNRALRFASTLLETGRAEEVVCIEGVGSWGNKGYAGWEVERRRFEMLGGRIIHGKPISLVQIAPQSWEFRVHDDRGVRVLMNVARVIYAGPFEEMPMVREYPPGSLLFEMEQTAAGSRPEDVEGWSEEEENGRWLGSKIVKSLMTELGQRKGELEWMFRRSKLRLKAQRAHREAPFEPRYDGKWIDRSDQKFIRVFEGVPKQAQRFRMVASLECFEDIPCNLCEKSCPESAIDITRRSGGDPSFLIESDCTACGLCLAACPSGAALLIQEDEERSFSRIALPWRGERELEKGMQVHLLNRRGERLGSSVVAGVSRAEGASDSVPLVEVEVPTHIVWEVRAIRPVRVPMTDREFEMVSAYYREDELGDGKVAITLDGETRRVRPKVSLALALYETGLERPEDALVCPDGSCGLCYMMIDGLKVLACQTPIKKGMKVDRVHTPEGQDLSGLCSCLRIQKEDVIRQIQQAGLTSPEGVTDYTHVGEGRCHGRFCTGALRGLLKAQGIDASDWIDWRFPSMDWSLVESRGGRGGGSGGSG